MCVRNVDVHVSCSSQYALSRNRQQCASSLFWPFDQPGRASEHARTAAPVTGLRHNNGERGRRRLSARCENQEVASLAKREPGRNSLKNHRAPAKGRAERGGPRNGSFEARERQRVGESPQETREREMQRA
ncbi:hypothetical protein PUN28_017839 [Cardiocondyla obscurior]|uniref:Uncharacterized protein n=1 Tax=Cardiocondyla obscurior TaxID=286306 RepID=A0AAW2EKW2_9HYME